MLKSLVRRTIEQIRQQQDGAEPDAKRFGSYRELIDHFATERANIEASVEEDELRQMLVANLNRQMDAALADLES